MSVRFRRALMLAVALCSLTVAAMAGGDSMAAASTDTPVAVSQESDTGYFAQVTDPSQGDAESGVVEFDENATRDTIESVRWQLIGIAILTTALLAGYAWHTSPVRRQRAAAADQD